MRFNEIYLELYPKYAPKFERKGLDFDKHFGYTFNNCMQTVKMTSKSRSLKRLKIYLLRMSAVNQRQRAGRFWRKVGKVVRYVLPFVKHIKIGKK